MRLQVYRKWVSLVCRRVSGPRSVQRGKKGTVGCHRPKPHLAGRTEGTCNDLASGSYFWSGYEVVLWCCLRMNFHARKNNRMSATLGVYFYPETPYKCYL